MKAFLIVIFIVFANLLQAQNKLVISGVVTDQEDGMPVKDVSVYVENKESTKVLTNRLGKYYITINADPENPPVIVFRSFVYDISKRPVKKSEIKRYSNSNDTLKINIQLQFVTLDTVTISGGPKTVFGSEEVSVSDFEFHGENFVMLAYEKRLDKGSKILYVDQNQHILSSFTVPDQAKELYKDFTGKIHVICEKKVYEVNVRDDIINLYPLEKDYFEKQVKPWVDTGESKAYMSNLAWYYPEFDYYVYSMEDSTFKKLHTVIDKPLMELYRAQYKYVDGRDKLEAYRAELATGVDKEIWIAIWSGFPNSIYYNALYAPMFVKEDTILIFDHYSNKLFRFNSNNEPIDSLDISYHLGQDKKEWEELLIKDSETNSIYCVFLHQGRYYLKELNTSTGEIKAVFGLTHKYPEKIRVKGDYAYYIYRPFESMQKKFLYKERIKG